MCFYFLVCYFVVKEGIALMDNGLSPYSGDIFHEVSALHTYLECFQSNLIGKMNFTTRERALRLSLLHCANLHEQGLCDRCLCVGEVGYLRLYNPRVCGYPRGKPEGENCERVDYEGCIL